MYLVEVEDEVELAGWLAHHHQELFEEELNGWYTDPGLWPRDRSLKMLRQWCSFELHTVVVDTGESSLEGDEFRRMSRVGQPATMPIRVFDPHRPRTKGENSTQGGAG